MASTNAPASDLSEQDPLLGVQNKGAKTLRFEEGDLDNPRNWPRKKKLTNVAIIGLMAVLSPLASSSFTPGISAIADDLHVDRDAVFSATTGYVIALGVGPLLLAPLSETVGRRWVYVVCFAIFSALQIPTGFSTTLEMLVALRTVAGFFGAAGIANGGGSISDMFDPSERSTVFGWYLLVIYVIFTLFWLILSKGPLLGPTLGPLIGGAVVDALSWRANFWMVGILGGMNTLTGLLFLQETYAPAILEARKRRYQAEGYRAVIEGQEDKPPLRRKLARSLSRPIRILFTQPVVFILSLYQAIVFGTTFVLFLNFEELFSRPPYNLSSTQVGALFLIPGAGYLIAIKFIVPRIDTIYNRMTQQNHGVSKPEFRLPLANVGAILVPASLFLFATGVAAEWPWYVTNLPTLTFGIGQICLTNTVTNYFIDSMPYAASTIAAGTLFRSLLSGVIPLLSTPIFNRLGYGKGLAVFAAATLILAPSPLLFQRYGEALRKRFQISFD